MCAYAPGVQDISGQLFAQGITQGVAGLNQGIQQWIKKDEEKKKQEQAFGMIRALTDPSIPDEAVRSSIKGLGVDGAIQTGQMLQQQKRQAMLDEENRKNQAIHNAGVEAGTRFKQREIDQMAANAAALKEAYNPTAALAAHLNSGGSFEGAPASNASMSSQDRVQAVIRGGGDAVTASRVANIDDTLAQAQQRLTPRTERSLQFVKGPNGEDIMFDGVNAQLIKKTPEKVDNSRQAQLAKLEAAAKQADAEGNPQLAAIYRWQMQTWASGSNEMTPQAMAAAFGGKPPALATGGSKLSPADQEALDWANRNPNDPRAAQIKRKLSTP